MLYIAIDVVFPDVFGLFIRAMSSPKMTRRASDAAAGAMLALQALQAVTDASQVPILKGLAALAILVINACQVPIMF